MNKQQRIALLQAQIASNPELTDQQLYDQLTVKTIAAKQKVQVRQLYLYLVENGLWVEFKDSVEDGVVTARDALEMFQTEIDTVNDYALFSVLIQGLVDATLFNFTATNQAEVLAMTDTLESWADQNMPDLRVGHIAEARI